MLSRVAESIYWMSRYLERAENIARFLEANWHLTLDLPGGDFDQWKALVEVTGDVPVFNEKYRKADKERVISFLVFDTDYPSSLISCVRAARENARTVREIMPSELWEQVNTIYHAIEATAKKPEAVYDDPYEFCQRVKNRGMLLGGIVNDAMSHGEGWHFFRMGRLMERADKTSRILDVKYFILLPSLNHVGTTYDDIQWAALLRTTSALQAYRQKFGRILPHNVAEFLLFDREFPRAVRHCLTHVQWSLHEIGGTPMGTFRNRAERLLGRLCAELSYKDIEEIFETGLHEFIDDLQLRMNAVHDAIADTFFCMPPECEPTEAVEIIE